MSLPTAELCDRHRDLVQVARPGLIHFGGRRAFHGPAVTLDVYEDNSLVRETLAQPGAGRVLVVDGRGSLRCALLGDRLGQLAVDKGWTGVVVHGCVRDTAELAKLPLGVVALAAHPLASVKAGAGSRDCVLHFARLRVAPGNFVYADDDGLLVAPHELT